MRSQEVAQMFGSSHIGTEHIAFALAETDDALGEILANAFDRAAIRERLGVAQGAPRADMVFSPGAKRVIELAFEHCRRLRQHFIAPPHLALAVLDVDDAPPLAAAKDDVRRDVTEVALRLGRVEKGQGERGEPERRGARPGGGAGSYPAAVVDVEGEPDEHPVKNAVAFALRHIRRPDTDLEVTVEARSGSELEGRWTFRVKAGEPK